MCVRYFARTRAKITTFESVELIEILEHTQGWVYVVPQPSDIFNKLYKLMFFNIYIAFFQNGAINVPPHYIYLQKN